MRSLNYVYVTFMVRSKVLHVHVVFTVTDKCLKKLVVQLKDLKASGRNILGLATGRKILGLGTGSHFYPLTHLKEPLFHS